MNRGILEDGRQERLKCAFHATTGLLLGTMALYSAAAFGCRGTPRLRWQAWAYMAAAMFEAAQAQRHLRSAHDDGRTLPRC